MKYKVLTILLTVLMSVSAIAGDFVIATGGEGGGYEAKGKRLAAAIQKQASTKSAQRKGVEFDFEILNTTGSGENIDLLDSGDAQMGLVQADALNVHKPSIQYKAKTVGSEAVWWLYNIKNDFSDLEDVEGNKKVQIVLIEGSGAVYTMQSFAQEDDGYKINYNNAVYADDIYDAFDMVCEGKSGKSKIAGLLYVGDSLPQEVKQDFSKCVKVGQATDSDFNDAEDVNGDDLYTKCKIPSTSYKPLSGSNSFSDEKTVCVNAMVIYSKDFEKDEMKVIKKGVAKAVKGMR